MPAATTSDMTQFADDATLAEKGKSADEIIQKLQNSFMQIKSYCEKHELILNAAKTQFILFKSPRRKILDNLSIELDGNVIQASDSVKLLGVWLDKHFTFSIHIEKAVKKAYGVLGALARAAPHLPHELLRMAYIALVRTNLEYASAVIASSAHTHLKRLDTVQKVASRIILQLPRDTHAAPLLQKLHLDSLDDRRSSHVISLVNDIINGKVHPALLNMFAVASDGTTIVDCTTHTARTAIGKRRFSVFAKDLANKVHTVEITNNGRQTQFSNNQQMIAIPVSSYPTITTCNSSSARGTVADDKST